MRASLLLSAALAAALNLAAESGVSIEKADPRMAVPSAAVKESGATVVGLSALMTTTVASMKDTIAALRQSCDGVRVIVGGAVLTDDLARYVGADVYARDAMDTVRYAEEFFA